MQPRGFTYRTVAVGGTFDLLHAGHKQLLSKAFDIGDKVFIGVTGDRLVALIHKNHPVRTFADRVRDVRAFIKSKGWKSRARIVELKEPFGPALKRKRIDALVVSRETRLSGARLNVIRKRKGLPPVRLYVVRTVKAEDGAPITSTRIRSGEIDSDGKLLPKNIVHRQS